MSTTTRYIKMGKKTAGHKEALMSKGYEVVENDGLLEIQASEVVEGELDFSTREKALAIVTEVVGKGAVFSYETAFKFADGKILSGIFAAGRLGAISALITKGPAKGEKARQLASMASMFDAIPSM
jgi:hypothetical protein